MELDRIFSRRAGVFVTINKKGVPRGCMGTVVPRQKDIAREIIDNAVRAAASDLRQRPLALHELDEVTFCVSIVGPLRPVQGMSDLAPDVLGLLVRSGSCEGILLPGEAKTASWQVKECRRKAGLPEDAPVRMYVFRTVTLEAKRIHADGSAE
jgi:AMMECR1 domain-containing protein